MISCSRYSDQIVLSSSKSWIKSPLASRIQKFLVALAHQGESGINLLFWWEKSLIFCLMFSESFDQISPCSLKIILEKPDHSSAANLLSQTRSTSKVWYVWSIRARRRRKSAWASFALVGITIEIKGLSDFIRNKEI